MDLAEQSGNVPQQVYSSLCLAAALFENGRVEEAEHLFRKADEMELAMKDNSFPHARRDIHSCDLLLDQRKYKEVQYRAGETLEIARERGPVHAAMNLISLGRAHLIQEQEEGTRNYSQAAKNLNCAVENLRLGGAQDEIPRGLLARAELHRFRGDYEQAERDLAEALRIAKRGGMGLHLADCHLESARLQLAQGNIDKARGDWETAKKMIEHMGYHRRDNEVNELAEQLA